MNILTAIWLVSAILSLLYGFLIFNTGSGSSFFLVWFLVSGFFAFCSFLSFQHRWSHTPGVFRLCFLLPVGTAAASLVLCDILILTAFPDRGEEELDCVIVLGCQVRPDGEPSRSLRSRLDTAAAYLKKNPDTAVIVSGGQGNNEPCSEAEAMAAYLESSGIEGGRIRLESLSSTTAENLRNSFRLCRPSDDRIGIVTSNYHLYRSLFIAKRLGGNHPSDDRIGIVTSNYHLYRSLFIAKRLGGNHICGIAAPSLPLYLPNNMLREILALLHSFLTRG